MKILKLVVCAVVLVAFASCSGYNEKKCEEIYDTIQEEGASELTVDDHSFMIDQVVAITKDLARKTKKCDSKAEVTEMMADEDNAQMSKYNKTFQSVLESADLSEKNEKKWKKAQKELDKIAADLKKEMQKKFQKALINGF